MAQGGLIPPIIVDILFAVDPAGLDAAKGAMDGFTAQVEGQTAAIGAAFDEQAAAAMRVAEATNVAAADQTAAAGRWVSVVDTATGDVTAAYLRASGAVGDAAAVVDAALGEQTAASTAAADAQVAAVARVTAAVDAAAGDQDAARATIDASAVSSAEAVEAASADMVTANETAAGSAEDTGGIFAAGKGRLMEWAAGLLGVGVVVDKSIKAFEGFDDAQTLLEAAVKNSGASWDEYKPKVEAAYASAVKFGDNNTEVARTLQELTTATNSPKKALSDLGLAENLAAVKGISLSAAGQMLARVYAGSNRAITQLGLNLDIGTAKLSSIRTATQSLAEAQTNLKTVEGEVATGQLTGAEASGELAAAHQKVSIAAANLSKDEKTVGIIMDALRQRTDGAAAAVGQTLPGEIAAAKAWLHNLATEIGEDAVPALQDVVHGVKDVIGWLDQSGGVFDTVRGIIDTVAHDIVQAWDTVAPAVAKVAEVAGSVLIPVLTDVWHVAEDVVDWFEKSGAATVALGAVAAAFAANAAKTLITSLIGMGEGAVNMGAKLVGLAPVFAATETQEEQVAATMKAAALSMQGAATQIEMAFAQVSAAATGMAEEIGGEATAAKASIAGIATEAETVAPEASAAFSGMLGPIGLVAGAAFALKGVFSGLFGSENAEVAAAKAVTSAKNAEASAILGAADAATAADSAFFGVVNAQEAVKSSHQAMESAIKQYGPNSTQARTATEAWRQSLVGLTQAQQTATAAEAAAVNKNKDAVASALKVVDATNKGIAAARGQLEGDEAMRRVVDRSNASMAKQDEWNKIVAQDEGTLTRKIQDHTAAVHGYVTAVATSQATELNYQRAQQGTIQLTGQAADKVMNLTAIYNQLPKNVQTKLAGDDTDALEKISGVIGALKQKGISTSTIVHILGNTTSAKQSISSLQKLLDGLPAKFKAVGADAGAGLAAGIEGSIPMIEAAAAEATNAATVSARVSIKAKSPSEVWHGIGTDMVAGLVEGLREGHGKVVSAATDLLNQGTNAAAGSVKNLTSAAASSSLPTSQPTSAAVITQGASNIEAIAKQALSRQAALVSSDTKAGQSELNKLVNATTSASLGDLNKDLDSVNTKALKELVQKLDATHDKNLKDLAKKVEAAYKSALKEQNTLVYNAMVTGMKTLASSFDTQASGLSTLYTAGSTLGIAGQTGQPATSAQEAPIVGASLANSGQLSNVLAQLIPSLEAGPLSTQAAGAYSAMFGGQSSDLGVDFGALASGKLNASDTSTMYSTIDGLIGSLATLETSVTSTASSIANTVGTSTAATATSTAATTTTNAPASQITVNMLGTTTEPTQVAQQLYLSIRPYLTAA